MQTRKQAKYGTVGVRSVVITYQIDELREFELDADGEDVAVVDNWSHDLIVVGEQVVVEALGVRIATAGQLDDQCQPAAYEQTEIDAGGPLLTSHCCFCCCTNAVDVVANAKRRRTNDVIRLLLLSTE